MTLSIYMIAGELSGDQLGAHLVDGFRAERDDVVFRGVGGPMMGARGVPSLFDMSDLSVMGIAEVLPKLRGLFRRISEVVEDIVAARPNVLVTIDSPDFCLRVAKRVRLRLPELKIVHYVAPSVWAWRPKRAHKMAAHVDHVLALLPFEPPYMHAAGVSCDFVGHPVAMIPQSSEADCAAFRAQIGVADASPLVCVLPGSRMGEVARSAEKFREVVTALKTDLPDLRVVVLAAGKGRDLVFDVFGKVESVTVLDTARMAEAEKMVAMAACDCALAVSGTVSLELASQNTPMVIAYDASWLTKTIMKRAFLLETATLVNIVSETRAVPEFIFERFDPSLIVPEVRALLDGVGVEAQRLAAETTMTQLGRGDLAPGVRAARSILKFLE